MRRLVSFDDPELARAFSRVLLAANIDSDVRRGQGRESSVWLLTESDRPRAEAILRAFVAQPPPGSAGSGPARAQSAGSAAKLFVQRMRASPITYGMLAICVFVTFLTNFGDRGDLVSQLSIASFERGDGVVRFNRYRDLLQGELWRLITPIFIHFSAVHLVFNALGAMDLGGPTERFQGRWHYITLVLWSAAVSNLAQLVFGRGPTFGGLSGVVYAYLGYLWARGQADPSCGIHVPRSWLNVMLGWMALGFSGLLDSVVAMANYAHLGGLLAGAAYGYVAGLIARRRA